MSEVGSGAGDAASRIARLEDLVERRLAAITVDSGNWSAEQIKEFIESLLREKDRALEMAGEEREKAASALRNDQQRALDQAEREREKAAQALRDQLVALITSGDNNLREHITQQIAQIEQLITNVEAVSVSRYGSLQREAGIQHAADQAAIAKAESANEARFAAANEWRGQSADRERTQQEQIASFVATLTPLAKTEAIEDKLAAASDRNKEDIEKVARRMDVREGQSTGVRLTTGVIVTVVGVIAAALGIVIVLANVFTGQ